MKRRPGAGASADDTGMSASSCPGPGVLSSYRSGLLDEPSREALERHAEACAACQDALWVLGASLETGEPDPLSEATLDRLVALARRRPARRWGSWPAAAAAALLLAAAGWHILDSSDRPARETSRNQRARLPVPETLPEGRLEAGAHPRACLAAGIDLLLEPGARILSEPGGRHLRAEAGACWLSVTRGPAATLALPEGFLELERGTVHVSLPPARAVSCLLQEAFADEATGTCIWILEGSAVLRAGNRVLRPAGGRALVRTPEGWMEEACTLEVMAALRASRASLAAALPGRGLVTAGFRLDAATPEARWAGAEPAAYRWVTVLQDRTAATELKFVFPAGGGWHAWTAALAGRPPAAREVLELIWDGEHLHGRLNGMPVFAVAREDLSKAFGPGEGDGAWRISVWGGSATVAQSVLQERP